MIPTVPTGFTLVGVDDRRCPGRTILVQRRHRVRCELVGGHAGGHLGFITPQDQERRIPPSGRVVWG